MIGVDRDIVNWIRASVSDIEVAVDIVTIESESYIGSKCSRIQCVRNNAIRIDGAAFQMGWPYEHRANEFEEGHVPLNCTVIVRGTVVFGETWVSCHEPSTVCATKPFIVNKMIRGIILYAYWDQVLIRIHRNRCLDSRHQKVNTLVGLQ